MKKVADNFDGFVEKVSDAIRTVLNTEMGQDITEKLLRLKLAENPQLTEEEWKATKSDFMTYMFCAFVKDNPSAMEELGEHVYNELNKDNDSTLGGPDYVCI